MEEHKNKVGLKDWIIPTVTGVAATLIASVLTELFKILPVFQNPSSLFISAWNNIIYFLNKPIALGSVLLMLIMFLLYVFYSIKLYAQDQQDSREKIEVLLKKLKEANKELIKELEEPVKPPYFKYTKDRFWHWYWEWEWIFDDTTGKWQIENLHALCPTCDIELINESKSFQYKDFELAKCPKCKSVYGYGGLGSKNAEDIESVYIRIRDNVKKGKY